MIAEAAAASSSNVTGAIRKAARMTGADFRYLLATAQVESNLNPNAAPRTSSARGLFQFVEQTWLATMKEQGTALGYGRYASSIERAPSGQYDVGDPKLRQAIMNLRSDPAANAAMAGAFTKTNAASLTDSLGRKPSEGELYVAHFLGAVGGGRLIGMAQTTPRLSAVEAFPVAARANPSIFYDKQGKSRAVGEVYRTLVERYDNARGPSGAITQIAKTTPVLEPGKPTPLQDSPRDTAKVTAVYAAASASSTPVATEPAYKLGDSGPAFHGLFHSGERPAGVSPMVSALWGAQANADSTIPAGNANLSAPQPTPERPVPLDLFSDQGSDARALFRGRM